MLTPNEAQETAKRFILEALLDQAKVLFEENSGLVSYGWSQFTATERQHKFCTYHNMRLPNINGNAGAYVQKTTMAELQSKVSEALRLFGLESLVMLFGSDVEICIYKDLIYEVTPL